MCSQSTKDVLDRVVHSSDLRCLCPPGTPKTIPLNQELASAAAPATAPSPPAGCSRQPPPAPCPPFSRSNESDSLHSVNPAFRLASPSPSLSRSTLTLAQGPDIGFIPLQ
ncbi:unnamed protein product [Menidia menidia]|uniref:(Atlantic silverside) hypothetical protein n=1 Tax=Menidia menidia TaxID=238744 RepID=A0A8S4BL85_9TELE|nr:unnamed protein product [Menidia menidia]